MIPSKYTFMVVYSFTGIPWWFRWLRICLQCGRPACKESAWVGKILLEEGMATHSSILTWRIPMDRGAHPAAVHGVAESQTRLSD